MGTALALLTAAYESGALGLLLGVVFGKTKWGKVIVAGVKAYFSKPKSSIEEAMDAPPPTDEELGKRVDALFAEAMRSNQQEDEETT